MWLHVLHQAPRRAVYITYAGASHADADEKRRYYDECVSPAPACYALFPCPAPLSNLVVPPGSFLRRGRVGCSDGLGVHEPDDADLVQTAVLADIRACSIY